MNYKIRILSIFLIFLLISCEKKQPSIVFFPDMYYSIAYETYQEAVQPYISDTNNVPLFQKNLGQTALLPVKNTISRNIPFDILAIKFDNSIKSYEYSKNILRSPLLGDRKKKLAIGKKLYEQNCAICHGNQGDGNGLMVQKGVYSGVPNYIDRNISVGSVNYVITYGKNIMGSYASSLNIEDRWCVAEYVINTFKKNSQK